jgi:lysophospholipase L1-like esterase
MKIPVQISRVDIVPPHQPKSVLVALGDSITEGDQSTTNAFRSWPDRLAERLTDAGLPWAVVNAGIGGNRLLHNGRGPSTLARLDRDVLSVPGARAVILLEGINDIGRAVGIASSMTPEGLRAAGANSEAVTADDLIWADQQIIARAHAQGLRVYGATLTPFKGSTAYTEAKEQIRQTLNHWILTTDLLDGAIDFDAAVRDPADPHKFRETFTGFDHLHPNDAGYAAMAQAVDLRMFGGR